MNTRCIKHIQKLAGTIAITTLFSVNTALAHNALPSHQPEFIDQAIMATLPYGFLSSTVQPVVDSAASTEEMQAVQNQLEAQAEQARRAKAAAAAATARLNQLRNGEMIPRAVYKSNSNRADSVVRNNFKKLGNYRLSFYCPCVTCNGRADGKTKIGTRMAEGRTIAVDSRIIPLGSRVYIDGYGIFIAEDTGSAIKGNRIDVCVASHSRAYDLGIDYADVYLID